MAEMVGKTLKKNEVRMGGVRDLSAPGAVNTSSATHRVRIVEQDNSHAVIEVGCICGERILVRCMFPGGG